MDGLLSRLFIQALNFRFNPALLCRIDFEFKSEVVTDGVFHFGQCSPPAIAESGNCLAPVDGDY
jgi:hypothetical protein